ncbi:MAG: GNAT family N-acetyltransferase [Proteobacteria bacterium]|nr:GNAT family N-acetyltransferase [Pseudomonadota bacterium]
MLRTELEWMQLHVETLFAADDAGRLVSCSPPHHGPPPRFFLGRTRHGVLWRFRGDVEGATVRTLSRLAAQERPLPPGHTRPAPPERLAAIAQALGQAVAEPPSWCGPAFRFPPPGSHPPREVDAALVRVLPGDPAPKQARLDPSDWPEGVPDLSNERAPLVLAVAGGRVCSLAVTARVGARAAEVGVETAVPDRGRGLAAAVVAAWAALQRGRREPLYSCAWENAGSRGVARRLGLEFYGEDLAYR